MSKECSVEGCDRKAICRGWCRAHYDRWSRNGDPGGAKIGRQGTAYADLVALVAADSDDCVVWDGSRTIMIPGGGGRRRSYQGLACEVAHGPRPEGAVASHLCGMGWEHQCVNGRHLTWETQAENLARMNEHGTHRQKGETHTMAKLTEDAVREIRSSSLTAQQEADRWGVTRRLVRAVRQGEVWKHVHP